MLKIYFFIFLMFSNSSSTNSWKSVTPLVSTRADVEKIIGKPEPNSKSESSAYYRTENERVFVLYSTGSCDIKPSHGWNVEKGKVINIEVVPFIPPKFADYIFDKSKFSTYRDDYVSLLHYANKKDGVEFAVNELEGAIEVFNYYPKSEDDHLLCK